MHAKMLAVDMEIVNGVNVYVNQDGQELIARFPHVLVLFATMTPTVLNLFATSALEMDNVETEEFATVVTDGQDRIVEQFSALGTVLVGSFAFPISPLISVSVTLVEVEEHVKFNCA